MNESSQCSESERKRKKKKKGAKKKGAGEQSESSCNDSEKVRRRKKGKKKGGAATFQAEVMSAGGSEVVDTAEGKPLEAPPAAVQKVQTMSPLLQEAEAKSPHHNGITPSAPPEPSAPPLDRVPSASPEPTAGTSSPLRPEHAPPARAPDAPLDYEPLSGRKLAKLNAWVESLPRDNLLEPAEFMRQRYGHRMKPSASTAAMTAPDAPTNPIQEFGS